jgi:hypothetical protein
MARDQTETVTSWEVMAMECDAGEDVDHAGGTEEGVVDKPGVDAVDMLSRLMSRE